MRIAVAYFLPPPGESADIGDYFLRSADATAGLQYVHVQRSRGLVLVTMFLLHLTGHEALDAARRLCSVVMEEELSRSWVLVEVATAGEGDTMPRSI
ncbi:hypothetical protein [Streptomyces winkii]|uniref:hypothetical protein n=1 Tax=Streptomyces winkii TaxID=3051178 RepID=UPI0028D8FABF|nr:hypothetical protein [Streptomyces sp. DSM 40971]